MFFLVIIVRVAKIAEEVAIGNLLKSDNLPSKN